MASKYDTKSDNDSDNVRVAITGFKHECDNGSRKSDFDPDRGRKSDSESDSDSDAAPAASGPEPSARVDTCRELAF